MSAKSYTQLHFQQIVTTHDEAREEEVREQPACATETVLIVNDDHALRNLCD